VSAWQAARRAAVARIPQGGHNSWGWAASEEGSAWVASTLGQNPDWRRFCLKRERTLGDDGCVET